MLLKQDLLEHTPKNHPDYETLRVILPNMEEVAIYINEEKNKYDNLTSLCSVASRVVGFSEVFISYDNALLCIFEEECLTWFLLQPFLKPGRHFVKEGPMLMQQNKRTVSAYLFLFSDILMITKIKRGSFVQMANNKATVRYHFKGLIHTTACTIQEQQQSTGKSHQH